MPRRRQATPIGTVGVVMGSDSDWEIMQHAVLQLTAFGVPHEAKVLSAHRTPDDAIARGVFGVPTLAIGDELFWGADATAMAADYLAQGCRFSDAEMIRVASLPAAAERDPTKQK